MKVWACERCRYLSRQQRKRHHQDGDGKDLCAGALLRKETKVENFFEFVHALSIRRRYSLRYLEPKACLGCGKKRLVRKNVRGRQDYCMDCRPGGASPTCHADAPDPSCRRCRHRLLVRALRARRKEQRAQ